MSRPSVRRATIAALAALGPCSLGAGSAAAGKQGQVAIPPTGDGSGGFRLTQMASFSKPTFADNAPGTKGNLYVVEQDGVVRVMSPSGAVRPGPFLDIRGLVRCCGEEGLLSIAFHPRYKRNRRFYVYFTNAAGDNQVVEFKRQRKDSKRFQANPASARPVLTIAHPSNGNHNGGQLQFGPDGLLYIAPGDGGGGGDQPNNAQNVDSLLGKLLRIDPRRQVPGKKRKRGKRARAARIRAYRIPKKNPFVGKLGRNEIYALGLRNPFRFSFDSLTGAISIGDVGQGCREEIDYRGRGGAKGVNFGWAAYEGTRVFNASRIAPGMVGPILEYDNSSAGPGCPALGGFTGVAVIAGYVVRDKSIAHQYGRLLYSDVGSGDVRSLIPTETAAQDDQSTGVVNPAGSPFSFAEGRFNRVYLLSGNGPVYRLDPA